jgi:TPR repeat protein
MSGVHIPSKPVLSRFSIKLSLALTCIGFQAGFAGNPQNPNSAANVALEPTGIVENVNVSPQPFGLAIEIEVSAPFLPQAIRLSNPDRLVFDFPGYALQGTNRHMPVNAGPVRELRLSLFQVHPPVVRIVVDSKAPLNFEIKPAGNKVVIEIAFPGASASVTPANAPTSAENKRTATNALETQPERAIASRPPSSQPTAYSLQAKARALKLDDLQALEDRAKAGDPEALTTLALSYHDAVLLKRDDAEALRLLHKAADRRFMAAEESLGIFAEMGIGMKQPAPSEALEWYKKAARQGSLDAATNIALMYSGGIGVAKDPAQAVNWFRQAATGGDATAQYNLALIYARGNGITKDYKESLRWLTAAANQNLPPALFDLATFYMNPPDGTPDDAGRALHYYEKAADLGMAQAQFRLGELLARNKESPSDRVSAYKWLFLAQSSIKSSTPVLSDLKKSMSQQEITQAEQEADNWWNAHRKNGQ